MSENELPSADVDSFFRPGGELSRAHPGYEHRPGQQAMAEQVATILDQGGSLMVEAGTGTGKTLAYLVPAVLSGQRVVISTGTRNLQDQIDHQDIPFLRDRMGLSFSSCIMKGRDNYLCRYRMAEFERQPLLEDVDERHWVPAIAEWSHHTATGDRAEIADLPDGLRLWRDVNARSDTCTGRRCPEYESCWLTQLKRRANESRIIVVNHHLFFADLAVRSSYGAVLPAYDSVIFDEAHMLEEIATIYFGLQAGSGQIEEIAREAERLTARNGGPTQGGGGAAQLRLAAREFLFPLRERLAGRRGRVPFERVADGGPDLEVEWAVLSEALDEVARQASRGEEAAEVVESLPDRVERFRLDLDRILQRDDPAFVYGAELRGRVSVTVSASPIDVSETLRTSLFGELHAAVLTSATLAVQGKFDFFRDRLGLEGAGTNAVESSFDYREQAILYMPSRMPEPRDPRFVERAVNEIVGLTEITEGRAFLLFTSYAMLHKVHAALADRSPWPLLVQGDGSKAALVDRFKTTPGAVLLGTTSFWHGVDVAGDALSLVVVDKLPFDVPSDPLVAARIDQIRKDDGNPFREYQLPLAVLELKQGLGRLLRSKSDRGILAVLDPRLISKRYGETFLRSLPPYRPVRALDACRDFFRGANE